MHRFGGKDYFPYDERRVAVEEEDRMTEEKTCSYVGWDPDKKMFIRCGEVGQLFIAKGKERFEVVSASEMNQARKSGARYSIRRYRETTLCAKHACLVRIECIPVSLMNEKLVLDAEKEDEFILASHIAGVETFV
jgi:hypothetical protein